MFYAGVKKYNWLPVATKVHWMITTFACGIWVVLLEVWQYHSIMCGTEEGNGDLPIKGLRSMSWISHINQSPN